MKSLTFGNFQVGQVDNPSVEDKGGFEFASGMDIFSEPGVMKASFAFSEVSYGASATPTANPNWYVETADGTYVRSYITAGDKLLESTDGSTFNLFLTNANGGNLGLEIWNGYIMYAAATKLGRCPVGTAGSKNDNWQTIDSDTSYHPMMKQGGTLKIGAGRYIASVDESFNLTAQAMKLENNSMIRCLAEHLTNLYIGRALGAVGGFALDSSVFSWRGTVLSSGAALPDVPYPMSLRAMNALLQDGRFLYAFPDSQGDILVFDGAGFPIYRKLYHLKTANAVLTMRPGAVSQYIDNTILFGGSVDQMPGVYQMKGNAICQAFVPAQATPGDSTVIDIGMIKQGRSGSLFIGYSKASNSSYHIEKLSSNRQNNAMVKTLWHRGKTDKYKRWGGVKLNLKPIPSGCSVKVEYRTDRNASFTDPGITINSTNQDKPAIFAAQPRSREIQYRFTFTTSTTNTPELLSYDPLYEPLNTVHG